MPGCRFGLGGTQDDCPAIEPPSALDGAPVPATGAVPMGV
jgi:hypothetical protein